MYRTMKDDNEVDQSRIFDVDFDRPWLEFLIRIPSD